MNISMLNKRITFQKNETVTDEIGNHLNTWSDDFSCMATISGESGKETLDAGTLTEHADLAFTVRSFKKTRAVTTTGYRIVMDGETYDILAIDHFAYNRKALKFRCQKTGSHEKQD